MDNLWASLKYFKAFWRTCEYCWSILKPFQGFVIIIWAFWRIYKHYWSIKKIGFVSISEPFSGFESIFEVFQSLLKDLWVFWNISEPFGGFEIFFFKFFKNILDQEFLSITYFRPFQEFSKVFQSISVNVKALHGSPNKALHLLLKLVWRTYFFNV